MRVPRFSALALCSAGKAHRPCSLRRGDAVASFAPGIKPRGWSAAWRDIVVHACGGASLRRTRAPRRSTRGSRFPTRRQKAQLQARASWDVASTAVTRLRPVPAQRAPRSAVVMPHGRGPGAARARGNEPRAQAPRPPPSQGVPIGSPAPRGEGKRNIIALIYLTERLRWDILASGDRAMTITT